MKRAGVSRWHIKKCTVTQQILLTGHVCSCERLEHPADSYHTCGTCLRLW